MPSRPRAPKSRTCTAAATAAVLLMVLVSPASAEIYVSLPGIGDDTATAGGIAAAGFELTPASIDEDGRFQPGYVSFVFDDSAGSEMVQLARAAAQGRSFDEVVVQIRKDDPNGYLDYLNYKGSRVVYALQTCQVVGWSTVVTKDGSLVYELVMSLEWADSTIQD